MEKKRVLVFLGLAAAAVFFWQRSLSREEGSVKGVEENKVILFVGATCPHCRKVETWLKENPVIKEKTGLVVKEVYYDELNAQELQVKAVECGKNERGGIGVPFLYDHGKCVIGDQPIIDYLGEKYQ